MPSNSYQTIRRETQAMIDGWEGTDVEFKLNCSGVDTEDFVAFANASGGTILIGVGEVDTEAGQAGEVVGCTVDDRTRNALINRAQSCNPSINIDITIENARTVSKQILCVDVPEGNHKPYGTEGGTYKMRVEGQNMGIRPDILLAMFLEREEETFLSRFREAARDVSEKLGRVEERISQHLERIEMAAGHAVHAAEEAAGGAQDAAAFAEEAAAAASDGASTTEDW